MSAVRQESFRTTRLVPPEVGLRLVGELDLSTVSQFEDALEELAGNGAVTLECSELTFIDSSGLHSIVRCTGGEDAQRRVIIEHPSEMMRRMLEITALIDHPLLEVSPDDER